MSDTSDLLLYDDKRSDIQARLAHITRVSTDWDMLSSATSDDVSTKVRLRRASATTAAANGIVRKFGTGYQEHTQRAVARVFQAMGLSRTSCFLDIGAGFGKARTSVVICVADSLHKLNAHLPPTQVVMHAAILGVSKSHGIEVVALRANAAASFLKEVPNASIWHVSAEEFISIPGRLDAYSHVFQFDTVFSTSSLQAIFQALNRIPGSVVLASFHSHRSVIKLGLKHATLRDRVRCRQTKGSQTFTCHIYDIANPTT